MITTTANQTTLIPLRLISEGGYFKIPGRRAIFQKVIDSATIQYRDHLPDGTPIISTKPGTWVRQKGKPIFKKCWWDRVEEVH